MKDLEPNSWGFLEGGGKLERRLESRGSGFLDSFQRFTGFVRFTKTLGFPESQIGIIMIRIGLAHGKHLKALFIVIHSIIIIFQDYCVK